MCAVTLLIVVHDTLLLTHLEAQGLMVQDFILGPGHCSNVQTVCSTCEVHVLGSSFGVMSEQLLL